MNTAVYLWQLLIQNPQMPADLVNLYTAPGQVQVSEMSKSPVDFAMGALACYHKTARFRGVNVIGYQWSQQYKYGADYSTIYKIYFTGMSGTPYQMVIAGMISSNGVRTAVIDENTIVPYSKDCMLERWSMPS